jgi:hypothetical protein
VIGLAGYKTISIALLVLLVALAGVSPVFAQTIFLTPTAACPGVPVLVEWRGTDDIVGGGISIAAMSPLDAVSVILESDPVGLIADPTCPSDTYCTFVVSESATCGGSYTVTVIVLDSSGANIFTGRALFDVPSTCCAAVGGCVQPVNTFALLSPWLVVIGLVGCVGTIVVVAKKRHA